MTSLSNCKEVAPNGRANTFDCIAGKPRPASSQNLGYFLLLISCTSIRPGMLVGCAGLLLDSASSEERVPNSKKTLWGRRYGYENRSFLQCSTSSLAAVAASGHGRDLKWRSACLSALSGCTDTGTPRKLAQQLSCAPPNPLSTGCYKC